MIECVLWVAQELRILISLRLGDCEDILSLLVVNENQRDGGGGGRFVACSSNGNHSTKCHSSAIREALISIGCPCCWQVRVRSHGSDP